MTYDLEEDPTRSTLDTRIYTLMGKGHAAAESGQWVEAGLAWMRASALGCKDGANHARSITLWQIKPLADRGDVDAQALLAGMLMDYFPDESLPRAADYARRAAEAGHPEGLRILGVMHAEGRGVAPDADRAMSLFRQAAAQGDGYAAFMVAGSDITTGRPMNLTHDECIELVGTMPLDPDRIHAGALLAARLADARQDEAALKWYLWAAGHGHEGAMLATAERYRYGVGTAVDRVRAMRWFLALHGGGNLTSLQEAFELGITMATEEIREAGAQAGHPREAQRLIVMITPRVSGPAPEYARRIGEQLADGKDPQRGAPRAVTGFNYPAHPIHPVRDAA
jgi:uncharacterized protein